MLGMKWEWDKIWLALKFTYLSFPNKKTSTISDTVPQVILHVPKKIINI